MYKFGYCIEQEQSITVVGNFIWYMMPESKGEQKEEKAEARWSM
jgi:hypothetical protein